MLVLARSKEAIGEDAGPQRVIANLKPHMKYLQRVPEAKDILKQAEELESTRMKEILHKANRFLAEKDADKVRSSMEGIKINHLDEDGKKLFEELNSGLNKLETIHTLSKNYSDTLKRGDHFAGREIAKQLAKIADQDDSKHWRAKMEKHSSRIKREWSFVSFNLEALPACYAFPDVKFATREAEACLLPGGRNLLIVSGSERWVLLRTFSMDEQKFQKGFILRSPKPMRWLTTKLVENVLWISDSNCNMIELSLDPFNILSYDDYSDFLAEDDVVENVFLFPKSRCFWIDKRNKRWEGKEGCIIISMDERHVIRSFKVNNFPLVVDNAGDHRIAVRNQSSQSVQFYSERGKPMENYPFDGTKFTGLAALHPNGVDYVFLTYDREGGFGSQEDTDGNEEGKYYMTLTMEVKPDVEDKYKPLKIEGSNGELIYSIFSLSDHGLIFVHFARGDATGCDFHLAAYKLSTRGFVQVYEVRTPRDIVFVHDEFAKQVVALNFSYGELQAMVLDENEPVFNHDLIDFIKESSSLPNFGTLHVCDTQPQTGHDNAASLAYTAEFSAYSASEFQNALRVIKKNAGPDEIIARINALQRIRKMDEVENLKLWMRKQYPDHPKVLLEQASEALEEKKRNTEAI